MSKLTRPIPPKAPRAATKIYTSKAVTAAIDAVEQVAGGRGALIQALLYAPAADDLAYVVGLLADPRNDTKPLAALCAEGRITVGELMAAYRAGVLTVIQARAAMALSSGLPAVVDDVLLRARDHDIPCPTCRGLTTITVAGKPDAAPEPCPTCRATGKVIQEADVTRQKMALELGGLGPRKAPVVDLSDRRTLALGGGTESLTSLLRAVDDVLHPKARPSSSAPESPSESSDVIDADLVASAPVDALGSSPDTSEDGRRAAPPLAATPASLRPE